MKKTTKNIRNGIQWTPWSQLEDLNSADDLALLSHSHKHMQGKIKLVNTVSTQLGLNINISKTNIMKVNTKNNPITSPLEETDSITYLDSTINKNGAQKKTSKQGYRKQEWHSSCCEQFGEQNKIKINTKLKIFNSNVKAVLLYGSETWQSTQKKLMRIQTFINKCLRRILHLKWTDKVPNTGKHNSGKQPSNYP